MLKLILARLGGLQGQHAAPADGSPAAGHIYAFRTSPFSAFSPPETGRWAAMKLIGVMEDLIVIAVLDGIWTRPPTLKEAARARTLRERRFAYTGKPAVFGMDPAAWRPGVLEDLTLLGTAPLQGEERRHVRRYLNREAGCSYASLIAASRNAEGEWRWAHDREAIIEDEQRAGAARAAAEAAREARYRTRLKSLTWDQLLTETPFQGWTPSPPYPPEDFTIAARERIHEACRELQALGVRPRKAEVRRSLKRCVEWFNDADAQAGGVIETGEREDICAVLEEVAFVAGQKGLVDEIDLWRDW